MKKTDNGLILDDKNDLISDIYPDKAEHLTTVKDKTLSFEDLNALAVETNILHGHFPLNESPRISAAELCGDWLERFTSDAQLENFDNAARLTIPILNEDNDYLQIYVVRKSNLQFTLTDDGETLSRIGADIAPTLLERYGVKLDGPDLTRKTKPDSFNSDMVFFIQAILTIPLLAIH